MTGGRARETTTGITLIHDYGQGGLFSGGNAIADSDGQLVGDVIGAEFQNDKSANLAANRLGYFHYTIHAHIYTAVPTSSGNAELPGDDLIVSLGCALSDSFVGNTLMHELGHNLGLRHGGGDTLNYKPNYNSVMNYQYQFPGVDTDCTQGGDGRTDYSRNQRITLNENALLETAGICGASGPGYDWNNNGAINSEALQIDINSDGQYSTLTDYDDWANLKLTWQPTLLARGVQEQAQCESSPPRR